MPPPLEISAAPSNKASWLGSGSRSSGLYGHCSELDKELMSLHAPSTRECVGGHFASFPQMHEAGSRNITPVNPHVVLVL